MKSWNSSLNNRKMMVTVPAFTLLLLVVTAAEHDGEPT